MHPNTAYRTGYAHRHAIWTAMDVDETSHSVDATAPVATDLATRKPKNARQDPFAARIFRRQFGCVEFASRRPLDEHRVYGLAGADLGADDVPAARGAVAAVPLTCTVART